MNDVVDTTIKAALPSLARGAVTKTVELSAGVIRSNIREFAAQFDELLGAEPAAEANAYIDEVELSLTVSASGGIQLVGSVSAGAQATIKVKLKRKQ